MTEATAFAPEDLRRVAERMHDLDICMLSTSGRRRLARPMSNNGQVEFDGDSWFFAPGGSPKVRRSRRSRAWRSATSPRSTASGCVEGDAEIVDDEQAKREHWFEGLGAGSPTARRTPRSSSSVPPRPASVPGAGDELDMRRG